MEWWEKNKQESENKKKSQNEFPFLGKKVRRRNRSKWEEGIVVLEKFDDEDEQEQFIKFGKDDLEQLIGLSFEVWNEEKQNWEKEG